MKYAVWEIYYPNNQKDGYTADQEITKRGFKAYGIMNIPGNKIFGTYEENANITGLENYLFQELSDEDAEKMLIEIANSVSLI